MNTSLYATRQEAIEREIHPALGEYAHQYDIEGIADEVLTFTDGYSPSQDAYIASERGFVSDVDPDEFWEIAERHRTMSDSTFVTETMTVVIDGHETDYCIEYDEETGMHYAVHQGHTTVVQDRYAFNHRIPDTLGATVAEALNRYLEWIGHE